MFFFENWKQILILFAVAHLRKYIFNILSFLKYIVKGCLHIKQYSINDAETSSFILEKLENIGYFNYKFTYSRGILSPNDWIVSKRIDKFFVAQVDNDFKTKIPILICHFSLIKSLLEHDIETKPNQNELKQETNVDIVDNDDQYETKPLPLSVVFISGGSYKDLYYFVRRIPCCENIIKMHDLSDQKRIVNAIEHNYLKKKLYTQRIYLSGKPCSGKSTIGYILAKRLNATFCPKFNPTIPGESLDTLVSTCRPTFNNPLIINFNEADEILFQLNENKIKKNEKIMQMVSSFKDWNDFIDDLSLIYPFVIFIMTGNTRKQDIDKLIDPKYLRSGRVDCTFVCNDNLNNNQHGYLFNDEPESIILENT